MNREIEVKKIIGQNLSYYRRINNLTQLQVAEQLNYSDKTISKWEKGDSLPDIYVLMRLTEIFGITLNDLIQKKKVKVKKVKIKRKALITTLSFGLCWLVATVIFVMFTIFELNLPRLWLAFIYAIPASMIVLIVFLKMWSKRIYLIFPTSVLFWSILLSIFLSFDLKQDTKMWMLLLIGIPLQILTVIWFFLKNESDREKKVKESIEEQNINNPNL